MAVSQCARYFIASRSISKLMDNSKAIGCLYGQLIGDSLGCRYEFRPSSVVQALIKSDREKDGFLPIRGGGAFKLVAGQVTDDSEMAFALAGSLCRCGGLDPADVACSYVRWAQSDPADIGNATASALDVVHRLSSNVADPVEEKLKVAVYDAVLANAKKFNATSRSNGCLMRISPLAVAVSTIDSSRIRGLVEKETLLTHCDPVCLDAVNAYVSAVASLINGKSNTEAYDIAKSVSDTDVVRDLLESAKKNATPVKVGDHFIVGDGPHMGYIGIALQSAFFELLHAKSFMDGVVDAVARGGDTDTNGAIVAAMLGARFGVGAIPERWLDTVRRAPVRCARLGISFDVEAIVPQLLQLAWTSVR